MATGGIGVSGDWREALEAAVEGSAGSPDLALLFASSHFRANYADVLQGIAERLGPRVLIGCSGQGIISTGAEHEHEPAISLLPLELPGAVLRAVHVEQGDLGTADGRIPRLAELEHEPVNAWVVLADPFTFDVDALIQRLEAGWPGVPVIGGMASAAPSAAGGRATSLFLNGDVLGGGALVLAVSGTWTVRAVVSQGAEPIGETWTVTAVEQNVVLGLGGRPPLEILNETLSALPREAQERAVRNLLVGLAMDEYRDAFARGDFLIRNIVGVDRSSGGLALSALPRVGQTVQFQVRDAEAADAELRAMLALAADEQGEGAPAGALLCSCNGRGEGLFGVRHHDAAALADAFGGLRSAGFFCNGEIGPVGGKNFLHGFTASIGFFVRTPGDG